MINLITLNDLTTMRRLTLAVSMLLAITAIEPTAYCFQAATSQTDSSATAQGKKSRSRRSSKDTAETTSASTAPKSKSGGKQAPANGEKIDLNTASESQLDSLPGVGPATAKKIVAGRPYSSVSDLSKAGVSAKTIGSITPMVSVGAAQGAAPATVPQQQPTTSKVKPATSAGMPRTQNQQGVGPGMVWVNPETKVFHRSGDRWYGKTKAGQYMTESDAIKAGYRESKEKTSSK